MKKQHTGSGFQNKNSGRIWEEPQWHFTGNISNLTGAFSVHELGSVRRLDRFVKRENFIDCYISDISSVFGLNDGQQVLLKYFLTNKDYVGTFKYNSESAAVWAEATGLKHSTVSGYFQSLVSAKGLIRMVRRTVYRLNKDFIFHPGEVKNADFLSIHLTYHFSEDGSSRSLEEAKQPMTMEYINACIEQFKQQEAMKTQAVDIEAGNPFIDKNRRNAQKKANVTGTGGEGHAPNGGQLPETEVS